MTATADPLIATEAADIARRSEAELEALVNISSPSGDVDAENVVPVRVMLR